MISKTQLEYIALCHLSVPAKLNATLRECENPGFFKKPRFYMFSLAIRFLGKVRLDALRPLVNYG